MSITTTQTLYLEWYEDNPKKSLEQRINEAVAAYRARFPEQPAPNIALVNAGQIPTDPPIAVRSDSRIRLNLVQVGYEKGGA
jgi:hypothetical protein